MAAHAEPSLSIDGADSSAPTKIVAFAARGGLPPSVPASRLAGWTTAAAAVTAVTVLLYPLQRADPGVSSGVLYVLCALLVSVRWGLGLGLVTSAASAAALYLFHTDPAGLHAKGAADLVAIGSLLVTAAIGSAIGASARTRAAVAEEHARLEEQLRHREAEAIRLEETRASRARVLEASDEERRRVVRDLHDGAQRRLVQSVITLKLARRALTDDAEAAGPLVGEALAHAQQANADLRDLVRGILPAALSRDGLGAAVDALITGAAIAVTANEDVPRVPPAIEATAYFVISESLSNVVKHSQAQVAQVRARVADGALRVEIEDDGIGNANPDGDGLLGLADRLAALDGELRVISPPAQGTTITATLPLPR
jgi:signal transduction histidine kinase